MGMRPTSRSAMSRAASSLLRVEWSQAAPEPNFCCKISLRRAEATPPKVGRRKGKFFLYVWGVVFYHDGFRPKRFIKFCHRYNWITREGGGVYRIDKNRARYHEHGNATDVS
jgi:hypothetical protein